MNKIFSTSFLVSILLLTSCNNTYKPKAEIKRFEDTTFLVRTQEREDFDIFINRFQKDSIFQKERIIFPLKNLLYNTDTESFDERTINKKEWKFMNFQNLPENYIKNITKLNNNEFNYNIQIEDTGVSVNYIFKIHNDKWYLVEIKDEST
jgi:hypothetical protein